MFKKSKSDVNFHQRRHLSEQRRSSIKIPAPPSPRHSTANANIEPNESNSNLNQNSANSAGKNNSTSIDNINGFYTKRRRSTIALIKNTLNKSSVNKVK